MKILFMGTEKFSASILENLIENNFQVVGAVSQENKQVGRKKIVKKTPVALLAEKYDIKLFQPRRIKEIKSELEKLDIDIIVTAAYGQIIPVNVLKIAKILPLNVHGSLLPHYRGAAPIQRAIQKGDIITGVTIMEMVKEMDAGRMLSKAEIEIGKNDTTDDIFSKMSIIGSKLLIQTLQMIEQNDYVLQEQNEDDVTFAPPIKRSEEIINWNNTAKQIHDHIRAFTSNPLTYTLYKGIEMKVWDTMIIDTESTGINGEVSEITKEGIIVQTQKGRLLIKRIKLAGKNEAFAYNFFQNVKNEKTILGEL